MTFERSPIEHFCITEHRSNTPAVFTGDDGPGPADFKLALKLIEATNTRVKHGVEPSCIRRTLRGESII